MIKPTHIVHLIHKAPAAEHGGFVAVAFADVLHAEHVLWYLALYLLVTGIAAMIAEYVKGVAE